MSKWLRLARGRKIGGYNKLLRRRDSLMGEDEAKDWEIEIAKLRKEIQELKARYEEREEARQRLWRERLAYWAIIAALVVGLISPL